MGETFKQIKENLEEFQRFSANSDPAAKARGYVLAAIFALYFLVFLVPDSVWISMGVTLPDEANISATVLMIMQHTSFPVSVYVFFKLAPFFFMLSFLYILIVAMSSGYKGFLRWRKEQVEKNFILVAGVFILAWPLLIWINPSEFLTPTSSLISSLPYRNKLLFGLLGSAGIVLLLPAAIVVICLDIRFRLTHLTNKEI